MANKQLTAKVNLNTKQFEARLKKIARGIDALNNSVRRGQSAYAAVNAALRVSDTQTNKVKQKTDRWKQSMDGVTASAKNTNGVLGSIGSKLKTFASTYLGIMGTRAMIKTSDTITSAQNRLNALNGGDAELTQQQMDKMYASANKVRMSYTDMISNASKSMTLAGDAFQGNMDNAIRFQEIMAETYALGGASSEEMSTSMYQMIQALGAGTLAGDELRSVREGAPLAYKEIEKFAQGIYNTTDSLKDMASEGKISSEMVVAAIMKAGGDIDKQFEKTAITFGQSWAKVKNAAVKAFEPVSNELSQMLNRAVENGAFEKIAKACVNVGKALLIAFELICRAINWVGENWNWLKYVVGAGFIVFIAWTIVYTAVAIQNAYWRIKMWIAEHKAMLKATSVIAIIIIAIYLLYQVWQQFTSGAISCCEAIVLALTIVGVAALIVGIIIKSIPMIFIAVILLALALIFTFFEQICGAVTWVGMLFKNVGLSVANFFIAIWNWLSAAFHNCCEKIVTKFKNVVNAIRNIALAIWNFLKALAQNIGIGFENAWIDAQNAFWSFIEGCLKGVKWLEPVINAVAKAFGAKGFTLSGVIEDVHNKKKDHKEFVSMSAAWDKGMNTYAYDSGDYQNLGDAWNKGISTYDVFQDGWGSDAYNSGANWASGVKGSINEWGSQFQNGGVSDKTSWLDNLSKELGLDYSFPNTGNGDYDTSKAYNAPTAEDLLKGVDNISDNTDKMVDLTEEDLEFMRKFANMEWKKEYTTANITVDMTNNNTINGESDLDGIVTRLSDKLREELNVVANGVYA